MPNNLNEPLILKDKRFYAYLRVSSLTALKKGHLETQRFQIDRKAGYEGITIVEYFIDGGVSGIDLKRLVEREKMLKKLESDKDIDGLIVETLDRLGRSAIDLGAIIEKVTNQWGKIIIDMNNHYETKTKEGFLLTQMHLTFAEFQRRWLKEKLDWGRERAIAEHKKLGRNPLNISDKDLKEAIKMYNSGIGLTSVGKYLQCSPNTARKLLKANSVEIRPIYYRKITK